MKAGETREISLMEYKKVLYDVQDNIARVTLNEPEKMNRLSYDMMTEIIHALNDANVNREVRVILITGAGDNAFCAGASLGEFDTHSAAGAKKFTDNYAQLARTFTSLRKPSIAMINGYALAGGCGLAMYPTFGIASETATFGLPEINVGIWSMIVMATLSRTVPRKKMLELLCTGDPINAYEAERIGMINKVVPAEELEETTVNLAEKLKSKSASTLGFGLEAFYTASDMEFSKALSYLSDLNGIVITSEDAGEGLSAFLEKRKPQWKSH